MESSWWAVGSTERLGHAHCVLAHHACFGHPAPFFGGTWWWDRAVSAVPCWPAHMLCCTARVVVQSSVPARFRADKQLVSHDIHTATYNYKYTFSVEIVPVCKVGHMGRQWVSGSVPRCSAHIVGPQCAMPGQVSRTPPGALVLRQLACTKLSQMSLLVSLMAAANHTFSTPAPVSTSCPHRMTSSACLPSCPAP